MNELATIDPQRFRQALGTFVTGVTIVTTRDGEGRPVGLTANSFNSVSLDPPLVLWSLALSSANLAAFRDAGHWAVHILSSDQQPLSQRFASRGVDKFAGLEFGEGPGGVPLLDGCAARFVCRATFEYEGGDHAIFVGEVVDLELAPATPLVFHSGRYSQVLPQDLPPARPDDAEGGAFARYFTGHLLARAYGAAFEDVRREYRRLGLSASEYSVLATLGLGEGVTDAALTERALEGGVQLPAEAVERLMARGAVARDGGALRLTDAGRNLLDTLGQVAEATQRKLDDRLNPGEMALLHDLLERVAGSSER